MPKSHAEDDKKRRELVETRNQAEGLIHTTERTLKEAGDKIPAGDKQAVEQAIAALKGVTAGEDVGEIRSKTEALAQVSMKIGEAMYKQQGAPGGEAGPQAEAGASQSGPSGGGDEKVVDADFEEVDENKKRGSG